MKYAIVEAGGKQYVVREGESLEVDRLPLEAGKTVKFDRVLLAVDDGRVLVGKPGVQGASIQGKVVEQFRGAKIVVFKYKPKQRYRRTQGHRQPYTRVSVSRIAWPASGKEKETESEEAAGSPKPRSRKKATAAEDQSE